MSALLGYKFCKFSKASLAAARASWSASLNADFIDDISSAECFSTIFDSQWLMMIATNVMVILSKQYSVALLQ